MKKDYYENYIENIYLGLKNSQFFIENKLVSRSQLFKNIRRLIISLRDNNNNIFFFGNGASAAFANHMALDFSKNGKIKSCNVIFRTNCNNHSIKNVDFPSNIFYKKVT